jgi:hypothetical protein
MHSTGSQAAVATGSSAPGVGSNPPPAPRVMPVYLPQKPKSHHERHVSSGTHGGQSGSDADRASVKVRYREPYFIPLDLSHFPAPHGEKSLGSRSTER